MWGVVGHIGTVHGVSSCSAVQSVPVWAIVGHIGTVHGILWDVEMRTQFNVKNMFYCF